MKALVAAFNQEKALVGAFSVITNLRMELFKALASSEAVQHQEAGGQQEAAGDYFRIIGTPGQMCAVHSEQGYHGSRDGSAVGQKS